MSIVHNRAVDCVRREETQRTRALRLGESSLADGGPPDPGEAVVNDIGFYQERTLARRALGDLPPAQRQIIDLVYFGGLSQTQIATMLELPLGTVKSRTLLGMRRLRLALSEIER